VAVFEINSRN